MWTACAKVEQQYARLRRRIVHEGSASEEHTPTSDKREHDRAHFEKRAEGLALAIGKQYSAGDDPGIYDYCRLGATHGMHCLEQRDVVNGSVCSRSLLCVWT